MNITSNSPDLVDQAREFAHVLAAESHARKFLEALCDRVESVEADLVVMNSVTAHSANLRVEIEELSGRLMALEQQFRPFLLDFPMQVRDALKSIR